MSGLAMGSAEARAPEARKASLLSRAERWSLAMRLTLSMFAAGLLGIAVLWRVLFPAEGGIAELVAGLAALLVAVPVLSAAYSSLRHPSLHGMSDQLVALALVACWATGDLMTAAILPIVMVIGHVLEERSLLGSREAIDALGRLVESTSIRVLADGTHEDVPTQDLRVGDHIALRAGDRVPVDGIIREGAASIDTASLTGESVPIDAVEGDVLLAGSIDLDGGLTLEVTKVGGETTLGKIVALMHQAERAKPPVTRLLEAYAGHYMALILLIAAGVWFATANTAAMLAVLVASCPCALVLAAPATAVAAIAVAARHGILIKSSAFLEQLAEVTSVVVDKTGTVTTGELTLIGARPAEGVSRADLLGLAASLGGASSHPVSRALANAAPTELRPHLREPREERGLGMRAWQGDEPVAMGRAMLLTTLGAVADAVPEHDGPIVGVCRGSRFLGWLMLADEPRPESRAAMEALRALGLNRQLLLTGDRASVARRIAGLLGITDVAAEALPEEKMLRVLDEVKRGFRPLVVGDGINDSLALKAGAVGVAMGAQGTDVALASADLVLMTSDLRRLATCVRLSRRCRRTIHLNVVLGLGWTAILIVLAACGLLGAEGAIVAAVVHNLSTLLGMANSGRLLRFDETGLVAPRGRRPAAPAAPTAALGAAA
jgi:Cd2+/Zn2+-exporting ATPase